MEIFLRNLNLVIISQKHGALYINTEVLFDGTGDTGSV